ncbi:MAG: chemotaxis protein CheW [Saprospiraceae bacterium]|nr:chemotaxis protein CheW [Pyrinomonadaceae bacterium]
MIDLNQELDVLDPVEFTNLPLSSIRDEHSAAQTCERFIAFYFGDKLYCVVAEMVAEVIHPLSVAILPNAPRGVLGIAALRGEVVTVLSLKDLLKEESGAANAKSKMIVLQRNENETQFAIPVDRMHEVVMLPSHMGAAELVRRIEHEGSVFNLIDIERLSAEISIQF